MKTRKINEESVGKRIDRCIPSIKKDISRISIVGNGIIRNFNSIHDILKLIEEEKLEILNFEISESKISITFKDIIEDKIVDKFHSIIFK